MPEAVPRRLGWSGPVISPLGLGTWAFGGPNWAAGLGPQDDDDSVRAIRRSLDVGITWIDTAPAYGAGRAEQVVERALRGVPGADRPLIFTKVGLICDEADPMATPRKASAPDSIRRECEASLARLRVDCIDLYQIHWPDEYGVPVEESWQAMLDLKQAGKVRYLGVSNFDAELLARCEELGHVDSLQPPFSMINRAAADDIRFCQQHGIGVLSYSPLQSGLLGGRYTRERAAALSEGDFRRSIPWFSGQGLDRSLALVERIATVAKRHDATVAEVALAWVLGWPGVTAAIVGARSEGDVASWASAAAVQLSARDLDEVTSAIEQTAAGVGPSCPLTGAP